MTNNDDLHELEETLQDVSLLIVNTTCNRAMNAGDFNCDIKRNTGQTRRIAEFMEEHGLTPVWEKYPIDFSHTTERNDKSWFSTIDHFLVTDIDSVMSAGVIHHPDNQSDHEPIFCQLDKTVISIPSANISPKAPGPAWRLASLEDKERYCSTLHKNLDLIAIPTQITECKDLRCKNPEHIAAIDWFTEEEEYSRLQRIGGSI